MTASNLASPVHASCILFTNVKLYTSYHVSIASKSKSLHVFVIPIASFGGNSIGVVSFLSVAVSLFADEVSLLLILGRPVHIPSSSTHGSLHVLHSSPKLSAALRTRLEYICVCSVCSQKVRMHCVYLGFEYKKLLCIQYCTTYHTIVHPLLTLQLGTSPKQLEHSSE